MKTARFSFLFIALSMFLFPLLSYAAEYSDATFNYKYTKSTKRARVVGPKKRTSKSYTVPSKITVDGDSYSVVIIGAYAFSDCDKMTTVTLPSSIETIEEGAFSNCTALQSVKIPSKVTSLPPICFSFCLDLHTVSLPSGLTTIGRGAFEYCSSLYTINIPSGLTSVGDYAFYAAKLPLMTTLPASLKTIGKEAFCNTEVEWFILPGEVDEIKEQAFADNHKLHALDMPRKVGTLGDRVFFGCVNLENVTMPETIGRMGMGMFERNDSLRYVTVSPSLTNIPERTFFECYLLENVALPSSIKSIGKDAFGECFELKNIILPSNLTTIETSAFEASGLESITIPASVTTIAANAFANCRSLTDVYSLATLPPMLATGGFSQATYDEALLHVADEALPRYRGDAEWSKFKSLLIPTGIESIDADKYSDLRFSVENGTLRLSLPEGLTLRIYDLAGRLVNETENAGDVAVTLTPGVYVVEYGSIREKIAIGRAQ